MERMIAGAERPAAAVRNVLSAMARVLLPLALLVVAASAQDIRGRVQGVVTDTTGAVIPAATVTLRNVNTNVAVERQTGAAGRYMFDFVLPGTYELRVGTEGFRTFVQQNILVQTRADITVNASLEIGAIAEVVTVEEAPVAVSFNDTTLETTLDTKMSSELPIIHRNPFLLAALDPAVNYRGGQENSPYHHWAASQMDVGGDTAYKNTVLMDGVPQLVGAKGTYVPAMDAVSEVNVQQNAVDAEYGHSAGGVLSVQMKSGTNDWHGTAYYFGRNPALNARPNPLTAQESVVRRNVWGVTSGNPIVKDKLFNYFAYEGQNTREPRSTALTLPTNLERAGDFSNSLNRNGGLRAIYDPFTTIITGPDTSSRQQFANNVIPSTRLDPSTQTVMQSMFDPNNPGDNPSGQNNFRFTYPQTFKYYNFSNRADWNVSDSVKVFGRISRFHTTQSDADFTNGSVLQPRAGSARNTWQGSGDVVWTINPTTVFSVRGSWSKIDDSFDAPEVEIGEEGLANLWPGNNWYASHVRDIPVVYHPELDVRADSRSRFGRSGYWFQTPKTYNWDMKLSKVVGRHSIKFGHQYRAQRVEAARPRGMLFRFDPDETADTIFAPQTQLVGHAWASTMLGTVSDASSRVQTVPVNRPHLDVFGFFVHDDFKVNRRITLNLGVRYEYETPMRDPENRLSRTIDFSQPLPELAAAMGEFPQQALALRNQPLNINGAWRFTDANNRGAWNAQKNVILPRAGIAYRINDRTALRIGYARYAVPPIQERDSLAILGSTPYPGFTATTNPLGPLEGVPRTLFSDPFPSGGQNGNPLIEPFGKTYGEYAVVGSSEGVYFQQDWKAGMNDRINLTVQREIVSRIVVDATFFMNFGFNHATNINTNLADPRIGFEAKSALNQRVDNPFFGVPQQYCPGALCNNRQVTVGSLLSPYPHFTGLTERAVSIRDQRYKSLQFKLQRPFANGFNFLMGYSHVWSQSDLFYDNVDMFDRNLTRWADPDSGHKLTLASIYELPFGRGRKFGSDMPKGVDAVLGGWSISGIYSYLSGQKLSFPGALVSGDPRVDKRTRQQWFNTDVFDVLPAFTRRTNPINYDNIRGPYFSNLDMTINKKFQVMEDLALELRMEAYNLTNSFMGANPSVDPGSGNFGQITSQLSTSSGREWQYSARFIW